MNAFDMRDASVNVPFVTRDIEARVACDSYCYTESALTILLLLDRNVTAVRDELSVDVETSVRYYIYVSRML